MYVQVEYLKLPKKDNSKQDYSKLNSFVSIIYNLDAKNNNFAVHAK